MKTVLHLIDDSFARLEHVVYEDSSVLDDIKISLFHPFKLKKWHNYDRCAETLTNETTGQYHFTCSSNIVFN